MPDFSTHPEAGQDVSSEEFKEFMAEFLSNSDRVSQGYAASDAGLTLTIQPGLAFIEGTKVGDLADSAVAKALTASSTNHVFLAKSGNVTVNTTGTPPASSIKLYEVVTDGSSVTDTTDLRPFEVRLADQLFATILNATQSGENILGHRIKLEGSQPYFKLIDTVTGLGFRVRNADGKVSLDSEDGSVVYVNNLGALSDKFKNPVKDKDLSTPPGSPVAGDRYIVKATGTGDWTGKDTQIATWNGSSWDFSGAPVEGWLVWVEDEDTFYHYVTSWATLGTDAATASKLVRRNASGQASFATPTSTAHAATKGYVDGVGTSSPTPDTVVRRDVSGRTQVAEPSAASDVATKQYVDGFTPSILQSGAHPTTTLTTSFQTLHTVDVSPTFQIVSPHGYISLYGVDGLSNKTFEFQIDFYEPDGSLIHTASSSTPAVLDSGIFFWSAWWNELIIQASDEDPSAGTEKTFNELTTFNVSTPQFNGKKISKVIFKGRVTSGTYTPGSGDLKIVLLGWNVSA